MPELDFDINPDDPRRPDVVRLLQAHLEFAREWSEPQNVHVFDAAELNSDQVRFFSARRKVRLLGIGALRLFEEGHSEIKSMHTTEEARGQGVGRAILERLLTVAFDRGDRRVSLETGTGEAFEPARSLYRGCGFKICPPFSDYRHCPDSVCMTRRLPSP
ncbi:MAG: GNAT family N-acetyltransferase [Phycisphaerales bacterium]|nr:GNAT family N-acetyltransferase [Phycisphaerales bacterium]